MHLSSEHIPNIRVTAIHLHTSALHRMSTATELLSKRSCCSLSRFQRRMLVLPTASLSVKPQLLYLHSNTCPRHPTQMPCSLVDTVSVRNPFSNCPAILQKSTAISACFTLHHREQFSAQVYLFLRSSSKPLAIRIRTRVLDLLQTQGAQRLTVVIRAVTSPWCPKSSPSTK